MIQSIYHRPAVGGDVEGVTVLHRGLAIASATSANGRRSALQWKVIVVLGADVNSRIS